jgi:hypothetical protein
VGSGVDDGAAVGRGVIVAAGREAGPHEAVISMIAITRHDCLDMCVEILFIFPLLIRDQLLLSESGWNLDKFYHIMNSIRSLSQTLNISEHTGRMDQDSARLASLSSVQCVRSFSLCAAARVQLWYSMEMVRLITRDVGQPI